MASEGCENAANARVGSGDLKTIVLWPVVAGCLLVSGCSSGEMTTADGEAGTSVGQEATPSENSDGEFAEPWTLSPFRTDLAIETVIIENFSKKSDFLKSL